MKAPGGIAPGPSSATASQPAPAASPAGPRRATKARPSRSSARSRSPSIGATAATDGSGRGTGMASPERGTRWSEATPPSDARSRMSGRADPRPGEGDVGSAGPVGLGPRRRRRGRPGAGRPRCCHHWWSSRGRGGGDCGRAPRDSEHEKPGEARRAAGGARAPRPGCRRARSVNAFRREERHRRTSPPMSAPVPASR